MSYEFTIGLVVGALILWIGLFSGFWMHKSAHKDGVKLMDRVDHNRQPYEDYDEELGQKTTGGEYEPMFDRGES